MREVTINISKLLPSGSVRLRHLLSLFLISAELIHMARLDDQEASLPVLLDKRGVLTRESGHHLH